VRGGIAVAEAVVGDGFLAAAQEGGEVRVHGGKMAARGAVGNPRGVAAENPAWTVGRDSS
jgi:hypothetical protein